MRHLGCCFTSFLMLLAIVWQTNDAYAQGDSGFKYIEVKVVDPDGKLLADVAVDIRIDSAEFPMPTDEDGMVAFNVPTNDKMRLRLKVNHAGYASMGASWNQGEDLPEQFTIRMQKGTPIGGIVHDEQGQPIEGAQVTGSIFWDKNSGQLRPTMEKEVCTTDAEGRWQYKSAPTSNVNLQFKISHPDFVSGRGYSRHGWSWDELQAQDQIYVLEKGVEIRGHVLDPKRQPVAEAKVAVGSSRFDSTRQIVMTNQAGEYLLKNLKQGEIILTVSTPDWAPDLRVVKVSGQTQKDPVDFQLQPPQTVRLRVVDPAGQPLPGVTILPENWRGHRALEDPFGRKKTNAEGIWEWHSAPADEVQYSIFAQGRFTLADSRAGFSPSDKLQDVIMHPAAIVTGKVIDKATRQPIEKFVFVEGVWWNDDSSRAILQGLEDYGRKFGKGGAFHFEMNSGCVKYLIYVKAEGYRPIRSREIFPEEGSVHLDFELEPSEDISGIVQLPSGKPAAGVEVVMATLNRGVYPFNGHITPLDRFPHAITDEQGRYTLPVVEAGYKIVYLHNVGVAELSETKHGASAEVMLQPWARVEGQIMPSARIAKAEQATLTHAGQNSQEPGEARISWYYRVKPDEEGRFVFERVPPKRMIVGGSFSYGDPGRMHPENTHTEELDLAPGETASVQIGGTGGKIKGQLAMPVGFHGEIPWHRGSVKLSQRAVGAASATQHRRSFATTITADGGFVVKDVLSGQYEFTAKIYTLSTDGRWRLLASTTQSCTVSEKQANDRTTTLDIGKIDLEIVEQK